ncbi:MAG: AAA family ATPase [Acidimicrobiia bacterium]|nr:AAA family ATPase [Acidimicrobiia bacterium]MYB25194.1 AAA family ATPase [Acidimicrobiia bacterium]MYJ14589.1 AAA family ATPase [Acidimicrobiia bacterium]
MRVSQNALETALDDFRELHYTRAVVSLFESFLVAKSLEARPGDDEAKIEQVNDAVKRLFVLDPSHPLGRLYPFRYDWRNPDDSGRKTVWNNTTRGPKLATSIFRNVGARPGEDIRNGLRSDASAILRDTLAEKGHRRPSTEALICLLLREHDFPAGSDWHDAGRVLLGQFALTEGDLENISIRRSPGCPLLGSPDWDVAQLPDRLAPPAAVRSIVVEQQPSATTPADEPEPAILDRRVERMLRLAVTSYRFVMLVGPPGTGKGRLVRWIADQVAGDPTALGFEEGFHPNPVWVTPDDTWSAFELVGGFVPADDGRLRWSSGCIPDVLRQNRWLVLDEANRADLDRIMGPLLTWLADEEVQIGRTEPHAGVPILLGWSRAGSSMAESDDIGESMRFLAGKDWRMIGTYNPQDAMRVFRFGLALSRRFVVVPVPLISPGQFEELLRAHHPGIEDPVVVAIQGLYSAHCSKPETSLGPAVFLRIGRYLESGTESDSLAEQLAEGYVLNVGKYLATYSDETLQMLGNRILDDEEVFTEDQWQWIISQRFSLS